MSLLFWLSLKTHSFQAEHQDAPSNPICPQDCHVWLSGPFTPFLHPSTNPKRNLSKFEEEEEECQTPASKIQDSLLAMEETLPILSPFKRYFSFSASRTVTTFFPISDKITSTSTLFSNSVFLSF